MHGFAAGETASFAPYRTTFSAVCCVCRRCRLSFGRQLLCRPKAPCTRPAGLSLRGECPGSVVFSGLRLFPAFLRAARFTVRRRRGSVLRKFSPCRSAVRGNAWYVRALKTISSWPRISCRAPPVSPICWRPLRGALPHPLSSFHRVCRVSCWPPPCCRGWSGHTS